MSTGQHAEERLASAASFGDLQPYAIDGLPVFQPFVAANGSWQFRCSCLEVHAHTPGAGPRRSRCETHRPRGYYLLEPRAT